MCMRYCIMINGTQLNHQHCSPCELGVRDVSAEKSCILVDIREPCLHLTAFPERCSREDFFPNCPDSSCTICGQNIHCGRTHA